MKISKENTVTIIIILAILLVAGLYVLYVVHKNKEIEKNNNPATQSLSVAPGGSEYTNLDGEVADLASYVGDILVVNSWASWSPFSSTELPMLANLASNYKGYGIKIIAINRSESQTTANRFLSLIEVNDKVELILDPNDRFYSSIDGYSMPETLIYDKSGKIVYHKRGVTNQSDVEEQLDKLISSYEGKD